MVANCIVCTVEDILFVHIKFPSRFVDLNAITPQKGPIATTNRVKQDTNSDPRTGCSKCNFKQLKMCYKTHM